MNTEGETSEDNLPEAFDINGSGEALAIHLLQGKLIRYTDDRFQVSSGECRFILKLVQAKEKLVLFYAQIPSIYPLPDDLKISIKKDLESYMKTMVNIEFINAGTQIQAKDILQNASLIGD